MAAVTTVEVFSPELPVACLRIRQPTHLCRPAALIAIEAAKPQPRTELNVKDRILIPYYKNVFTRLLVLLLAAFAATGCDGDEIKWTEEVKLHDGRVVQIKRRIELSSVGFPKRGNPQYHELCYAPMGLHWRSKALYEPEAFDIVNGTPYIRIPLRGCSSCMLHEYPQTNSIFYAWIGRQWTKIDEKQAPDELRFNLLRKTYVEDDGTKDARGLITLAEKEQRDANLYTVLRRTGSKGLNEVPKLRDYCRKCKDIPGTTASSAEVLLTPGQSGCSW